MSQKPKRLSSLMTTPKFYFLKHFYTIISTIILLSVKAGMSSLEKSKKENLAYNGKVPSKKKSNAFVLVGKVILFGSQLFQEILLD